MEIVIVEYGTELYAKTVALREKVLREPLGMKFDKEFLAQDTDNIHIAAIEQGNVLGTLLLKPLDNKTVKMRQVAVDPDLQRSGVGTAMVKFSEQIARSRGFERIVLHARKYAIPFYKRLDYEVVGDEFLEIGIPHYKMQKRII